ncbi:MAG: hypothetical protein KC431_20180 [Myxococcales bacterium]|nr:hypothetical protein [Myxococcales bacterium]MCA9699854.1 hypothetical protein [Myxococcales bacterium]
MDELSERFALAERQGLIDIVRSHPNVLLVDLLALVEDGRVGKLLGTLTVSECQSGEADADSIESVDKAALRAVYDARLLEVLRQADEPLSPNEVREQIGGTVHEARIALQRLAAAKKVKRIWKSRGHGYALI